MKMLFFSANGQEVEEVSREFAMAGIDCEVRGLDSKKGKTPEGEVWIRNDRDCHRAFMLCVSRGIGFARRPVEAVDLDFEW